MKRYIFLILFIFAYVLCWGQAPFGNEWIKENQKYIKIKVSENGIYRISQSQLANTHLLNGGINPQNLQLFLNGVEVPIYVEGEANEVLESGEFIEFYGRKNNGKLDEILYNPTGLQPNPEVSLYDDASYYYLTVAPTAGKRYQNTNISSSGLTAEPFVRYTSSGNYAESYYPGSYLIDVMSLSEYIEGEGYLGNLYGLGTTQTRILATPNAFSTTIFTPTLSYYVAGRSNAAASSGGGNNHHLNVSIGGSILADAKFSGYNTTRGTVNLTYPLISENTAVNFSSINDLGAVTDFQAVGYARITYARNTDAANFNSLIFGLTNYNPEVLLNFTNNSWTEAYLLDETNQRRYIGNKTGSATSFVVNGQSVNELVLASNSGIKTPTSIENITFNLVKFNSHNAKLLIVTHKNLLSGANEFATYKTSKGFSTLVITTDELYDQFYYGQHHPLAIKNFARYLLLNATPVKPEYLMLLGKGLETPKFNLNADLVPTMGFPSSDSYLTSEIIDNSMSPALATGRIPAKTNDEVIVYLNKVKKYDLQENAIWRKNIINITGGANSSEDASFSFYLKSLSAIAAKEYFGANTINYYKSVTDPITDNLMAKISNNINDGVGLLNFLGHGSTTSTAVSIGNPAYLNNGDKLLTYIVNGCSTGNAFVGGSLGEDYIFQNNKGAIAWIGTSSEGVASYLYNYTSLLFQNVFNTNYGTSIAQNMARAAKTYQTANDNLNRAHLRQYIYLGDPTISFYAPTLPDYEINNESVGVEDGNVQASAPTIKLFAIVKNIGKATTNDVQIQVSRVLPNNTIVNYPVQNFNKIFNTDTISIEIDNSLPNVNGNNRFIITVDPNNLISEVSKANNKAEFNQLLQTDGLSIIYPARFAIVSEADVELKAQANDIFLKEQSYIFEIDTVKTFDSSLKKTSPLINANAITTWKPTITLEDQKVYYWRVKRNNAPSATWETSSFTFINQSSAGWNQSHYQQYDEILGRNIILDANTKQFDFTSSAFPVLIRTKGNDGPASADRRTRISASVGALSFAPADFDGLAIASFSNKTTFQMYSYPSVYNFKNDGVNGTGQFYFNTNNSTDVDALNEYLQNIPEGYYVTGFNGKNFNPKNLPTATLALLTSLGLQKIATINNGEPYAFWTQKATLKKISPLELTADYTSQTPTTEQIIDFSYDLLYPWGSGTITSEKIGPAMQWTEATFNFENEPADNLLYSIIGVDNLGNEIALKSNITNPQIDLSDISAESYPYLKIAANVVDNTDKTMPTFKGWKVLYDGYPDVSFNTDLKDVFYSKSINQGDSLKIEIGITNFEKTISDSVLVKYKITRENRTMINGTIETLKPLAYGENIVTKFAYPTNEIAGNNNLQLHLEPKNKRDKIEFNNYAVYNVNVVKDVREPLVEVYFDSRRIINGDIVSPNPKIAVSILDENKFLLLTDTTHIELYLKLEEEANFRRIAFSDNKVQINSIGTNDNNKIDFMYSPETLADGKYTLKLRGKDASGNYNTNADFVINFEVVNEQAISNFLPYPNPFTTKMKFVYQITGKVPDKIKVQIMTVTGKIVREVFKEELGIINIGNNISDFTWDGTDQFGDRLANGVYFYNVIIENNDKSVVKHRNNNTDAYFKKNFGKIYLMR